MATQPGSAVAVEFDETEIPLPVGPEAAHGTATPEPLTLRLDDLIEDNNGEVVLFNDSALPLVALEAEAAVVSEGTSGPHHTAAGDDVTGFRFVSFDNGLTLYYQDGLDLVIRADAG
jgi:hypothetical protein